jgi:hypothetical protein
MGVTPLQCFPKKYASFAEIEDCALNGGANKAFLSHANIRISGIALNELQ